MKDGVSERCRRFVLQNPDIARCLERGVVNLSALAREICGARTEDFQAAVASLKRLQKRRSKHPRTSTFLSLLKSARLVISSRVVVIALKRSEGVERVLAELLKERASDVSTIVTGHNLVSVTCTDEQAARIKKQCGAQFVEEIRSLTQLTLLFPAKAVSTVGFSAYITSLLSSQQINIHAEATCAGEHLIVVSETDLQRAIAILGI